MNEEIILYDTDSCPPGLDLEEVFSIYRNSKENSGFGVLIWSSQDGAQQPKVWGTEKFTKLKKVYTIDTEVIDEDGLVKLIELIRDDKNGQTKG